MLYFIVYLIFKCSIIYLLFLVIDFGFFFFFKQKPAYERRISDWSSDVCSSDLSTAGGTSATAKFMVGEHTKVITDDGRSVEPGSGETGRVAVGGFQPVGYYKDPEKFAATFISFEGKRYSVPGDYATVEADGSLTLLGRGSVCINTGGEKVYPEEVEEVLKTHSAVADAGAVGLPDEKVGADVTAGVGPDGQECG